MQMAADLQLSADEAIDAIASAAAAFRSDGRCGGAVDGAARCALAPAAASAPAPPPRFIAAWIRAPFPATCRTEADGVVTWSANAALCAAYSAMGKADRLARMCRGSAGELDGEWVKVFPRQDQLLLRQMVQEGLARVAPAALPALSAAAHWRALGRTPAAGVDVGGAALDVRLFEDDERGDLCVELCSWRAVRLADAGERPFRARIRMVARARCNQLWRITRLEPFEVPAFACGLGAGIEGLRQLGIGSSSTANAPSTRENDAANGALAEPPRARARLCDPPPQSQPRVQPGPSGAELAEGSAANGGAQPQPVLHPAWPLLFKRPAAPCQSDRFSALGLASPITTTALATVFGAGGQLRAPLAPGCAFNAPALPLACSTGAFFGAPAALRVRSAPVPAFALGSGDAGARVPAALALDVAAGTLGHAHAHLASVAGDTSPCAGGVPHGGASFPALHRFSNGPFAPAVLCAPQHVQLARPSWAVRSAGAGAGRAFDECARALAAHPSMATCAGAARWPPRWLPATSSGFAGSVPAPTPHAPGASTGHAATANVEAGAFGVVDAVATTAAGAGGAADGATSGEPAGRARTPEEGETELPHAAGVRLDALRACRPGAPPAPVAADVSLNALPDATGGVVQAPPPRTAGSGAPLLAEYNAVEVGASEDEAFELFADEMAMLRSFDQLVSEGLSW